MTSGILFAFLALICWGFGDFFIQKTTRAIGIWKALLFIGITGFVLLFPFAIASGAFHSLSPTDIGLLIGIAMVAFLAALVDFEALKEGKLAVVEPIIGLELPITILLAVLFLGETLTLPHFMLAITIFIGIVLTVTEHHTHLHYHRRIFERGVFYSLLGAIGLALVNFFVGLSSKEFPPIFVIWFIHSLLAVFCFIYLAQKKELASIARSFKAQPGSIIAQSVFDNAGWIAYAFATSISSLSLTVTLTESYIALAALLGVLVNREKLKPHQVVGVILTIAAVIMLGAFVG